jgi:hypothetical protein
LAFDKVFLYYQLKSIAFFFLFVIERWIEKKKRLGEN